MICRETSEKYAKQIRDIITNRTFESEMDHTVKYLDYSLIGSKTSDGSGRYIYTRNLIFRYTESAENGLKGNLNKIFLHFLPNFGYI